MGTPEMVVQIKVESIPGGGTIAIAYDDIGELVSVNRYDRDEAIRLCKKKAKEKVEDHYRVTFKVEDLY
jgi:hypothetical protein